MGRRYDFVGKKFGKLTVISDAGNNRHGASLWECKCECGNTKIIKGHSLFLGRSKSCGCQQPIVASKTFRKGLEPWESGFRAVYNQYKKRAIERGHTFELTHEQFLKFNKGNCYYCGSPPSCVWDKKNSFGTFRYNGVDRIDNNKGYTLDNCRTCCSVCNSMKSNRTTRKFLYQVKKIYNHTKKK